MDNCYTYVMTFNNPEHESQQLHRDSLIFEVSISKLICVVTKLNQMKDRFVIVFLNFLVLTV